MAVEKFHGIVPSHIMWHYMVYIKHILAYNPGLYHRPIINWYKARQNAPITTFSSKFMVSQYQGINTYTYAWGSVRRSSDLTFIIWATGKPAKWFWRNLWAEKILEINLRISLIAIYPFHGKFYHFMQNLSILPVQVWIYLMVPDLGLRRRTFLHQPNITNRNIPFGSNVRWNFCSMEKSKIKSSILFRKFYLCHTSKIELFIVYDHYELDKNWTNRIPAFHFSLK